MVVEWYSSHHACEKKLFSVVLTVAFIFLSHMKTCLFILNLCSLWCLGIMTQNNSLAFGDYHGDFLEYRIYRLIVITYITKGYDATTQLPYDITPVWVRKYLCTSPRLVYLSIFSVCRCADNKYARRYRFWPHREIHLGHLINDKH